MERKYIEEQRTSPLYGVWAGMKSRCYTTTNKSYKNYGGRGIKVCEEWLNDYISFYNWAITNGYRQGLSIDRIDVNGNYEPSNCRWADASTQSRNKRNNIFISYDGETRVMQDWAECVTVTRSGFAKRINAGWKVEEALEIEPHKPNFHAPNKKEIEQLDLDGNVIATFASAFDAAKILSLPRTSINRACLSHRRHSDGWAFRFKGDNTPIYDYECYCKIIQYDMDGNLIKKWDSVHEIHKTLGYSIGSIRACCNGTSKSSHGFIWKSIDGSRKFSDRSKYKIKQYDLQGNFIAEFWSISEAACKTGISGDCISRSARGRNNCVGAGYVWKREEVR